ncbi:hypothetical protein [Phenylobacterium sp. J367]|uniref:hypothetical protein n=1 Tax=Phenylobacterium sp. J367 TaxID=2898435 RepID=UPI002150F721|nr:hypothetical protein [Phenylobacterium sp. J367]MCR5879420.1 hypothetical protein [Phenylobacterium sp. J367]
MRQFETAFAPMRDADPAVARLIQTELHAGEAMAVAIHVREGLIRLAAANGDARRESRAA